MAFAARSKKMVFIACVPYLSIPCSELNRIRTSTSHKPGCGLLEEEVHCRRVG